MSQPFTKSLILGLAVAALYPTQAAFAQSAACLSSPSTANCSEPLVPQATTQQISPTFPNPQPTCQKVNNSCAFDLAVPVASQQEWSSFLESTFLHTPGTCASVSDCAADCPAGNWGLTSFVDLTGIPLNLSGCYWSLPDSSSGQTQTPANPVPNASCQGYYPSDPGIGWFAETQTLRLLSVTCTPSGYQGLVEGIYANCEAGGRVRRCEGYLYTYTTVNLVKE